MKVLKIIGAIVLGSVTMVSVLGLFAPHKIVVAESVTINASAEKVFEKVNLWVHFKDWSPWGKPDSNMKISFEGVDGTVGSVYKWAGNDEVGTGSMTKTLVQPNSRIEYDLHFMEPWESKNKGYITVEREGDAQKVTWGFTADAPFPKNVLMLFMQGYIADDFKKGLNRLKEILEQKS